MIQLETSICYADFVFLNKVNETLSIKMAQEVNLLPHILQVGVTQTI